MFFSLIQTLVCVLLVNGGLYALHLTGSNGGGGGGSSSSGGSLSGNNNNLASASSSLNGGHSSSSHLNSGGQMKNPSSSSFHSSSNRINEELADLAQRERERLMAIGLAKQTAEESGYHGRPVITGRIKMHPVDDMDSEYSNWLNQQARNVMFGSVVKQPAPPLMNEEDYEDELSYEPLGRRPTKYEYGRVVQPAEREFENPHNLDLDEFMELEQMADEEDAFPDLDGYAYLEDLMAEENKERMQQHHQQQQQQHHNVPQFPGFRQQQHHAQNPYGYQSQEPQMEQQQHAQQYNTKYANNIRLQQKWQRKRAQMQQPQLQRNIFGQKNKQQQPHYFKAVQSTHKFSLANSEATATSKINPHLNEFKDTNQMDNHSGSNNNNNSSGTSNNNIVSAIGEQQKPDQLLHPNHKRSGGGGGGTAGMSAAAAAAAAAVSSPHSLANQLMLRSARGQRQYDVPQIECPTAMDGMERFACPTPDVQGRYRCIDDHVLCDGFIDCPEGEDEDRRSCMFYKTTKAHLDVLADALLRWARGR
ncbi:putative mediator of RNA polymerase II transcription subunit 26 [Musca vetustissima]|uniref:putative mediator of RNA polymerase II transcription subunit 26 n=1 Tax=Musca vetustissima TaxID=27455 RepID=UPI002AB6198C|nr:putative mediator of RNA polymerase II transcription subunit 26 [Musca vetustissima]